MTDWIDISVPLRTPMQHWPGDPAPDIALGRMHMHPHTGTHIDAPLHYVPGGLTIDAMPLDAAVGEARVIGVPGEVIDAEAIHAIKPQRGERILFRTSNSERCWCGACFRKQYVSVTPDGARALIEAGVQTVGVDYLSVGPYGADGDETHTILLGAGVWIIEGLNLAGVEPGRYELVCLPLKIEGGDGAPARAMLRKLI
jgi:arylformamidase